VLGAVQSERHSIFRFPCGHLPRRHVIVAWFASGWRIRGRTALLVPSNPTGFDSLDVAYACREIALAVTKIEEGLHWLHHRTLERTRRGVEGPHEV
jgi:hypothetical protein